MISDVLKQYKRKHVCKHEKPDYMSIKRETEDAVVIPSNVEQFFAVYVPPPPRVIWFAVQNQR